MRTKWERAGHGLGYGGLESGDTAISDPVGARCPERWIPRSRFGLPGVLVEPLELGHELFVCEPLFLDRLCDPVQDWWLFGPG